MTVHEPDTMVCHVMVSTIWRWVSSLWRFPLRREPAAHRAGPFLEKHLDLAHGLWLGRSSNVTAERQCPETIRLTGPRLACRGLVHVNATSLVCKPDAQRCACRGVLPTSVPVPCAWERDAAEG